MLSRINEPHDAEEVENHPFRLHINFSVFPNLTFTARDIQFCHLEGEMGESHVLDGANVISSEFVNFHAHHTTWRRTDVKDCSLKDAVFEDSDLHFTSWLNDVFVNVVFRRVTITDVVLTDCTFIGTTFEDCDLSHMLIKRCTLVDCAFLRCRTSNKLIEASVLRRTSFSSTDIEVATVLENFGLSSTLCTGLAVFVDRPSMRMIKPGLLMREVESDSLSPIQQLKLAYFVTGTLPIGVLERALDVASWIPLCRVPSSFAQILHGFASFLLGEFEDDRLIAAPLLRLYSTARALAGTVATATDTPLRAEFEAAIAAASLTLLPLFEQHLTWVQKLSTTHFPRLQFLAEGPPQPAYFDSTLRELLGENASFRVESVIPSNSPSILTLLFEHEATLVTLISIFLASRFRFELNKIQTEEVSARPALIGGQGEKSRALEVRGADKFLAFDAGMAPGERLAYHIRAYALFPQGVAAILQLEIGLALVTKIRSVLLEILRPPKSE